MSRKTTPAHSDRQVLARFWAKVNKGTDSGCWLWTASLRNKGYGAFAYTVDDKLIQDRAHRFSWVIHNGDIPERLCVLHRCDVPACVNPEHLFLGTIADNNRDMRDKERHVRGGTYCGAGNYKRGEGHHNARLCADEVRAIRADHLAGLSLSNLAVKYGIGQPHVSQIVRRKLWRHID